MSKLIHMIDKMKQSIHEKYGHPFEHWVNLIKSTGLEKHGEMMKVLKSEHGFTHGFANLVVHAARESGSAMVEDKDGLVNQQYSKGKENLKPIYDKLIKAISKFGSDVEIAPKNSYVSIRRKKQFCLIQPSTKTRVDVGINLKGDDVTDRLEASGSFNAMVSHRVRMTEIAEVDKELINWIKEAYDRSA